MSDSAGLTIPARADDDQDVPPSRTVAVTVVDVSEARNPAHTTQLVERALAATSPGRYIAALWRQPLTWDSERPVEAWVLDAALGDPLTRSDLATSSLQYAGNLIVRTYPPNLGTAPSGVYSVVLLRRSGPAPYTRAKADNPGDMIPLTPVLTRDAANSVWHVYDTDPVARITARLAHLLAWSDEDVATVALDGATHRTAKPVLPADEIVPAARKVPYPVPAGGRRAVVAVVQPVPRDDGDLRLFTL